MRWRWWDVRYDRVDENRGWLRSVKVGPVIVNRWHVDGRRGCSLAFGSWTVWRRERQTADPRTAA